MIRGKRRATDSDLKNRESYRELRAKLKIQHPEKQIITILHSSDGKDVFPVGYEVAKTFSRTGEKVLLIDGNMSRVTAKEHYLSSHDSKPSLGFSDVLKYPEKMDQAIIRVNEGVDILINTSVEEFSTELLEAANSGDFFTRLRSKYDRIFISSPSNTESIDGLLLSRRADGALYVAQKYHSKLQSIELYGKMLSEAQVQLLGVIMEELD